MSKRTKKASRQSETKIYGVTWTDKDAKRAAKEGWAIFEAHHVTCSTSVFEIERIDSPEDPEVKVFRSDTQAIQHIIRKAAAGSSLHLRALKIHREGLRSWRMMVAQSTAVGYTKPKDYFGPTDYWLGIILLLLASDAVSEQDIRKCAKAFTVIQSVVEKHANATKGKRAEAFAMLQSAAEKQVKTDQLKQAAETLKQYVAEELGFF